jgi:hypothetical protein
MPRSVAGTPDREKFRKLNSNISWRNSSTTHTRPGNAASTIRPPWLIAALPAS